MKYISSMGRAQVGPGPGQGCWGGRWEGGRGGAAGGVPVPGPQKR